MFEYQSERSLFVKINSYIFESQIERRLFVRVRFLIRHLLGGNLNQENDSIILGMGSLCGYVPE